MVIDCRLRLKMTEAGFAEELLLLVFVDVEEESLEVLDPGVVLVVVEQIDCFGILLFADVVGTALSTIMGKSVEVHIDAHLVLCLWNFVWRDWIGELIEVVLSEIVLVFCFAVSVVICWMKITENSITEAAIVIVVNIDHCVLIADEVG